MSLNPYEHDDPDGLYDGMSEPLYCRECGGYLGEYETADPAQVIFWNSWPWCREHGEEMQRLAKSPDHIEQVRR